MFEYLLKQILHLFYLISIPFQKWWRLCVKGEYLPKDKQEKELRKYLHKIIENPNYEPENKIEEEFELRLQAAHQEILETCEDLTEEDKDYLSNRAAYAKEFLDILNTFPQVDEDNN